MDIAAAKKGSVEAGNAFERWANANRSKIHVDALDEAAMGFAAGYAAALEALEEAQGKLEAVRREVDEDEISDSENGLWSAVSAIRRILRGSKEAP